MKRTFRTLFSLLLALVLVLSLGITAFAAESTISFQGKEEGFAFAPGSEYTSTDLFGSFKDVMPGDKRTETITFTNEAKDCQYIKLYMQAVAHDAEGNPLTYSEPFENEDGKDQANVDGQRDETKVTMADFLAQLNMKIYNGDTLIYEASPDELDGLKEPVLLGTVANGETVVLTVELEVPITLDNRYANRVGEVDWKFISEGLMDLTVVKKWAGDSGNQSNRPKSIKASLYDGETLVETVELSKANDWTYTWTNLDTEGKWEIKESVVPSGYKASYKTKNNVVTITNTAILIQTGQLNWPILVLGSLGILMLAVGLLMMRKRKNKYA